ncbi:MAG: helix-turn-helix domain-containing protein [Bacilli bacterium]
MKKESPKKDYNAILANNLIFYRKAMGLTQIQVAEKLSYSDKNISKWERGEGTPDIFALKTLADLYGISINDFLKEKPRKFKQPNFKKRLITVLLSVGIVWLVASVLFAGFMIFSNGHLKDSWLVFVYATIPTFILFTVFANVYKNRFYSLISVSGLIWCVALSIYLTCLKYTDISVIWLIFIIPIPLQILAILWFLLKWSFKGFVEHFKLNKKGDKKDENSNQH